MIGAFQLGVVAAAISADSGGSDPQWADVGLLLHFDGGLTDSSHPSRTVSAIGSPTFNLSLARFGSSIQLAGSDGVRIDNFDIPINGDWTVEFSARFTSIGAIGVIYNQAIGTGYYPLQILITAAGKIQARGFGSGITMAFDIMSPSSVLATTWYVIGVKRTAGAVSLWIDGSMVASTACTQTLYGPGLNLSIGAYSTGAYGMVGNIDELRVTAANRDLSLVPSVPFPDA